MNNNVVPLFGNRKVAEPKPVSTDITGLVVAVKNWAEEQGVDIANDVGFHIRCSDFMAYLQILARDGELKNATAI